ncbi:pectinesterase 2-like [Telopea speciosissima]|uniref:pectinesterase 2-like n=1 Tax=Telopea speciosissima TaxID=54955 RepID=UPI001CC752E9|nr:pectinesterase 2-like [Telopea speciosissima]
MATMRNTLTASLFLAFISFCATLSPTPADINLWCTKTPYPEACKSSMSTSQDLHSNTPKGKPDFMKTIIHAAMEQTLLARTQIALLGSKCRNEMEKAAWADCLELYEDSVLLLNYTIDPYNHCTDFDKQTWLSTALTNLDTCRAGFVELNVSDYVLPLMSNDASKLISNSLAVNNVGQPQQEQTSQNGFPTWVSPGHRKLLQVKSKTIEANLTVAQDGSGNYRTIQAALDAASKIKRGSTRFVIYVKKGVYEENLDIGKSLKHIMLIGDTLRETIITGNRSVGGGSTTFRSATVAVMGDGFIAQGITFRNTAGPQNGQAVALRSGADKSVFYRCAFEGYQDTLYAHSQRQFFKECFIYGTVDFIFGNAAVVFQNCMIYARKPMNGQSNTITAQGRTDPNQNTGISIHDSRVMAAADLVQVQNSVLTYLGRPWKEYSRTVYLQTYMDSLIDSAGWLEWNNTFALNTLYYGEYKNMGPGSSTAGRVKWSGYHVITNASVATKFTVGQFINGDSWLPGTAVRYTSGL